MIKHDLPSFLKIRVFFGLLLVIVILFIIGSCRRVSAGVYLTVAEAGQACMAGIDHASKTYCAGMVTIEGLSCYYLYSCGPDVPSHPGCPRVDTFCVDPDACEGERESLEASCGEGNYDIDLDTCIGTCDSCEDLDPSPEEVCGNGKIVWDYTPTCQFHCEDDPCVDHDPKPTEVCSADGGVVVWDDYEICHYHCENDNPPDSCEDAALECSTAKLHEKCGDEGSGSAVFECSEAADGSVESYSCIITCDDPDGAAPPKDTDGDGIPDVDDDDDDGDGIPDVDDDDQDGDGIPDKTPDPKNPDTIDQDGDGIPNVDDDDIDGDGTPNDQDDDDDGDGTPDVDDDDKDGDGNPDSDPDPTSPDTDGDGTPNHRDPDIDGDGTPNDQDDDIDGDGTPNDQDDDKDGDGKPDYDDDPEPGGETCGELNAVCMNKCPEGDFQCETYSNPEYDTIAAWYTCGCPAGGQDADDNDGGNEWLEAIKHNTDTLVNNTSETNRWLRSIKGNSDLSLGQQQISNDYLDHIAENTQISVKNQTAVNNTLKTGNDLLRELVDKETSVDVDVDLEPVVEAIDNISSGSYTGGASSSDYDPGDDYVHDGSGSTLGSDFGGRL